MRNFADRIVNAEKKFFGVHSPSKDCETAAHIPSWEEINSGAAIATAVAASNFQNLTDDLFPKDPPMPSWNINSVLYAGYKWLGFNDTQILFSSNGIDWEVTIDLGSICGKPLFLAYDGVLYTAVVCENYNVYAYHSEDGKEWHAVKALAGTDIHFAHKKEAEALASILYGWKSRIVRARHGGAWAKGWIFSATPLSESDLAKKMADTIVEGLKTGAIK